MSTLSGGNQQKVVVGRWVTPTARLLLLDEPFAGIDLGARAEIGQRLRDTAAGRATVVASSDIDELLEVADRIIVMADGAIVADHPAAAVSRAVYARLAAGRPGMTATTRGAGRSRLVGLLLRYGLLLLIGVLVVVFALLEPAFGSIATASRSCARSPSSRSSPAPSP